MRSVTFKAGDTILKEGEQGNTAYQIRSGAAKVVIETRGGSRKVAMLEAGEVFGEMCLLEPGPRSASVIAVTNVDCLETTYEDFISSIKEDPQQAIAFMQTLVQRLRQSNEMLAKLDPQKRGIGALLRDLQHSMSFDSVDLSDEAANRPYFSW